MRFTNNTQKKEIDDKKEISPIAVAVTGAVIGVGVVVGGVVAFKDKKNREKAKKAFINVKDKAINYMEEKSHKPKGKLELVKDKHDDIAKKKGKVIAKPKKLNIENVEKQKH